MKKNFLVRVDYSSLNGLGHIIRQINFLKKLDKNFFFYILSNKSNINISFILNRNTSLIKISTIKNKKIQFEKDAKITLKILKKYKCDYLIVDNYLLSSQWYNLVYTNFKNLIVFHDYKSNFKFKYLFNNQRKASNLIKINELGFLNNEIIKKRLYKKNLNFKRFIIDFGSIDNNNLTSSILEHIIKNNITYERIDVFLGPFNKNRNQIKQKYKSFSKISFYELKIPKKYNYHSGIFLGSAGITSLENLYLGKILFIFASSNNQIERLKYLRRKKNVYHLGSVMNNKKINLDKYLNNRFLIKSINAYNFNLFSEMKSKEILKLNKYTEFINKTLNGSNENKKF